MQQDGNFYYQPPTGWTGTSTFTYQAADGNGGTDTAEVTVAVNDSSITPACNTIPYVERDGGRPSGISVVSGNDTGRNFGGDLFRYNPDSVGGVGDIDGDGDKDIAYLNCVSKKDCRLKYTDGTNTVDLTMSPDVDIRSVGGVGDIDGDGDVDIPFIWTNDDGDRGVSYTDANGNSENLMYTNTPHPTDGGNRYAIDDLGGVADFDGDGKMAVTMLDEYWHKEILAQDGDDFGTRVIELPRTGGLIDGIGGVGDIDGDGDLDIVYRSGSLLRYIDKNGNQSIVKQYDRNHNFTIREVGGVSNIDDDVKLEVAYRGRGTSFKLPGNSYSYTSVRFADDSGDFTTLWSTIRAGVLGYQCAKTAVGGGSPTPTDDTHTTPQDQTLTVTDTSNGLLDNDTDPDDDPLTVDSIVTSPTDGIIQNYNSDGTFTYKPANGFVGDDSFEYEISDTKNNTAQAQATVTVTPTASATTTGSITVQFKDQDGNIVDANNISYTPQYERGGTNLTALTNTDLQKETKNGGKRVYDVPITSNKRLAQITQNDIDLPTDTTFASDWIDKQTQSDDGFENTENKSYLRTASSTTANQPPEAVDDTFTTAPGAVLDANVLTPDKGMNDSDPDSNHSTADLTATKTSDPSHGDITNFDASDGSFRYNPTSTNWTGTDTFTYEAEDSDGATDEATVTIAVEEQVSVTLTADPSEVESGNETEISWETENADDCEWTGGFSGSADASGGDQTDNPTEETTYSMQCSGSDGDTASDSVTVSIEQSKDFANDDYYCVMEGETAEIPNKGVLANDDLSESTLELDYGNVDQIVTYINEGSADSESAAQMFSANHDDESSASDSVVRFSGSGIDKSSCYWSEGEGTENFEDDFTHYKLDYSDHEIDGFDYIDSFSANPYAVTCTTNNSDTIETRIDNVDNKDDRFEEGGFSYRSNSSNEAVKTYGGPVGDTRSFTYTVQSFPDGYDYVQNDDPELENTRNVEFFVSSPKIRLDETPNSATQDVEATYFKSGTTMYGVEDPVFYDPQTVKEYSLSSSGDISTASEVAEGPEAGGFLEFSNDGTKMLAMKGGEVTEWTLSTAWDITTASQTGQWNEVPNSDVEYGGSLTFAKNGTKAYTSRRTLGGVVELDLSTAYDLDTASITHSSKTFPGEDVGGGSVQGIAINDSGTRLMVTKAPDRASIAVFDLGTAYDITTINKLGEVLVSPRNKTPYSTNGTFNDCVGAPYSLSVRGDTVYTGTSLRQYKVQSSWGF